MIVASGVQKNDLRNPGRGCNSRLHSGPLVARRKCRNSLKLDHPMQTGWRTAAALVHRDLTRTLRLALWGHFGNKMGTGLATSAQCGYNVRASGQYRNCLAIKAFKYHRNAFPIPRVWQTYRTQNPVPESCSSPGYCSGLKRRMGSRSGCSTNPAVRIQPLQAQLGSQSESMTSPIALIVSLVQVFPRDNDSGTASGCQVDPIDLARLH